MSRYIYNIFDIEEIKSKIDLNRLSRDYSKFPLKTTKNGIGSEYMPKKDIEYLYIELNLHVCEIALWANTNGRKIERNIKKYNLNKSQDLIQKQRDNTNMMKYGGKSPMCSEEVLKKSNNTNIKKYGCKWFSQTNNWKQTILLKRMEIDNKIYITKKKNHTFKYSKPEKEIYKILKTKFSNVIIHLDPSELYPFQCDFYIPELDLYIEYQGHWTHGKEPFNSHNINHVQLVEEYKKKAKEKNFQNKNKNHFLKFIEVWTQRDPLKRTVAKKNNLNWIEFFNMEQFMEWFDKQ